MAEHNEHWVDVHVLARRNIAPWLSYTRKKDAMAVSDEWYYSARQRTMVSQHPEIWLSANTKKLQNKTHVY